MRGGARGSRHRIFSLAPSPAPLHGEWARPAEGERAGGSEPPCGRRGAAGGARWRRLGPHPRADPAQAGHFPEPPVIFSQFALGCALTTTFSSACCQTQARFCCANEFGFSSSDLSRSGTCLGFFQTQGNPVQRRVSLPVAGGGTGQSLRSLPTQSLQDYVKIMPECFCFPYLLRMSQHTPF